MEPNKKD